MVRIIMRQSRKQTAWKKSRTFGDVKGGRRWPKLKDNIVKRKHSLLKPSEFDELPIYMVENPSKDFYFPITIDDIKNVLAQLPPEHVEGLTHIWLRKTNKKEKYQGVYTVGSGVRLITLYPFPKSNQLILGKERPTHKLLTEESARRYYLERLLLHEIGHYVNETLVRNKAARYKSENSADNYAFNMKIDI